MIGSPIDICLVRFQSEYTLPPEQRRNYNNVFDAMWKIAKNEGVPTLWRGCVGFCGRVMAVTFTQLTVFEETKKHVTKLRANSEHDFLSRMVAVFFSGIFVTIVGLPFDNIKFKLQKMVEVDSSGTGLGKKEFPYKGFVDCLSKTVQREGILGLWIGFPAFYLLAAPHTMISLLVQDYLTHHFADSLK